MIVLENCKVCQNSPKIEHFDDMKLCISCCKLKVSGTIGECSIFSEWNEKNKSREIIEQQVKPTWSIASKINTKIVSSTGRPFVKQVNTRRT